MESTIEYRGVIKEIKKKSMDILKLYNNERKINKFLREYSDKLSLIYDLNIVLYVDQRVLNSTTSYMELEVNLHIENGIHDIIYSEPITTITYNSDDTNIREDVCNDEVSRICGNISHIIRTKQGTILTYDEMCKIINTERDRSIRYDIFLDYTIDKIPPYYRKVDNTEDYYDIVESEEYVCKYRLKVLNSDNNKTIFDDIVYITKI